MCKLIQMYSCHHILSPLSGWFLQVFPYALCCPSPSRVQRDVCVSKKRISKDNHCSCMSCMIFLWQVIRFSWCHYFLQWDVYCLLYKVLNGSQHVCFQKKWMLIFALLESLLSRLRSNLGWGKVISSFTVTHTRLISFYLGT